MKSITKASLIAALFGCGSVPLSAQSLDDLRSAGSVNIAISNEPPATLIDPDGRVTGAAPDIVRAVMERLGVPELDATVSEFGSMIPGLHASRYDMIAAGLFVLPKRCEAVLFAEPDLCDAEGFAVVRKELQELSSFEQIALQDDIRLGVLGGSSEEALAKENGVPTNRITIVPEPQSGIALLTSNRIDVLALPVTTLGPLIDKVGASDQVTLIAPVENTPIQCAAPAFHPSAAEFRDQYNKAYLELRKEGVIDEILSSYGFSAELPKKTSTAELCSR